MKFALVIYNPVVEKLKVAIKFAEIAVSNGDEVKFVFVGKCFNKNLRIIDFEEFGLKDEIQLLLKKGVEIFACSVSIVVDKFKDDGAFPICNMGKYYEICKWADKLVYF